MGGALSPSGSAAVGLAAHLREAHGVDAQPLDRLSRVTAEREVEVERTGTWTLSLPTAGLFATPAGRCPRGKVAREERELTREYPGRRRLSQSGVSPPPSAGRREASGASRTGRGAFSEPPWGLL